MTQAIKASIMVVVDDQPANLKLLEDMLKQQGYGVRSFPRGRLALAVAAQSPPDLILLDINMPELDGFEVCKRLKSNSELAGVPVIFLSALHETEDKVKALRSGGVDYITKPFQFDELRLRVETHLKLHQLQRAVQQHNDHLEEVVVARTRELADAHARLRVLDKCKSDFLQLISHELRTPLNGLLGVGGLMMCELSNNPGNDELQCMFNESRQRILTLLDHASLLTQIEVEPERFVPKCVPLNEVLTAAIDQTFTLAQQQQVKLYTAPTETALVVGTADLLVKALQLLVETAVKLSEANETVHLTCHCVPHAIQVVIESRGHTIPNPALPQFFELLSIGEASTSAGYLGLGPSLAYRILALFGGSVRVENQHPPGIKMTVSLRWFGIDHPVLAEQAAEPES